MPRKTARKFQLRVTEGASKLIGKGSRWTADTKAERDLIAAANDWLKLGRLESRLTTARFAELVADDGPPDRVTKLEREVCERRARFVLLGFLGRAEKCRSFSNVTEVLAYWTQDPEMQRRVKARREWEKMDVANLGIPVTFRRADSRQLRQLRGPDAPPLLDGIIVSLKDPGNAKLQPTSAVPMSKPTGDVHPETRTDSPKNFAALYQCSVRTLMRRIKAKAIRAERIHSKLYRIAVADLPAKLTHKLTQKLTS